MTGLDQILKSVGGGLLAIGILLAGAAGWKPGMNAFAASLPDPSLVLIGGIGLASVGGLMLLVGQVRGRLGARQDGGHVVVRGAGATGEMMMSQPKGPKRAAVSSLGVQKRICLKPVWPQRDTGHWVGGVPSLPEEMPWPEINGKPACFIAQIALADMPETLWQGVGPRTGWLVFFGDGETDYDIEVRHVEGDVAPRAHPAGATYFWNLDTSAEGLLHLVGSAGQVPPRWFIDVADQSTLGAVEDMAQPADPVTGESYFFDAVHGKWVWETKHALSRRDVTARISLPAYINGTSWLTPLAVLAALRVKLTEMCKSIAYSTTTHEGWQARFEKEIAELAVLASGEDALGAQARTDMADKRKQLEQLNQRHADRGKALPIIAAKLEMISELEEELRLTSQTVAYDPQIGADMHALAQDVKAILKSEANQSLSGVRETFGQIMEHHARLAFSMDRSAVSPALFDLYAPLWQQECEETAIFLGTNIDMRAAVMATNGSSVGKPVGEVSFFRLLDMPPNPLTGLTIGDASRFYADVPAEDLQVGDFSRAYASNTHGKY